MSGRAEPSADTGHQPPPNQARLRERQVVDWRGSAANGQPENNPAALGRLGQLTSAAHAQAIYAGLGLERLGSWEELVADRVDY